MWISLGSINMLPRKPTAIKLSQEDIQDYDNFAAAQKETPPTTKDNSSQPHKSQKGKEVAATSEDRQHVMDERIGVTASARGVRR